MATKTINQLTTKPTDIESTDNFEIQTAGGTSYKVPYSAMSGGSTDTQAGLMTYALNNPYKFNVYFNDFNSTQTRVTSSHAGDNYFATNTTGYITSGAQVGVSGFYFAVSSGDRRYYPLAENSAFGSKVGIFNGANEWIIATRLQNFTSGSSLVSGLTEIEFLPTYFTDPCPRFQAESGGNVEFSYQPTHATAPVSIDMGFVPGANTHSLLAWHKDGVITCWLDNSLHDTYIKPSGTANWTNTKGTPYIAIGGTNKEGTFDYLFIACER